MLANSALYPWRQGTRKGSGRLREGAGLPPCTGRRRQRGIGAPGLICPSEGPGATWRIRETWASSRSRPRCTEVSGFDPPVESESLLTELVSAAILSASPERLRLKSKLATSCDLVF